MVGVNPDGQLITGVVALNQLAAFPDHTIASIKRRMGTMEPIPLGDQTFTPPEISAMILRRLRDRASRALGQPVTRAVITVPAFFDESQRQATREAGELAGLQVERIINEPTAATLVYHVGEQDQKHILVYDFGGGTFDVSIVDVFDGTLEIRASSGETFLGGEDFTDTMTARILERVGEVFERAEVSKPLMVARLRKECEAAKRAMTRNDSATVRIPDNSGEILESCRTESITRAEFQAWTTSIIERVDAPVRRALGDANLKRADVDEAVLVGGATRMSGVVERVGNLFGREPKCSINPDEVVAVGAAVQAGTRHAGVRAAESVSHVGTHGAPRHGHAQRCCAKTEVRHCGTSVGVAGSLPQRWVWLLLGAAG